MKRTFLFKVFALLSPLLLLAILELTLRLFGYGHDLGLFVSDPADPAYLVMNKYASEKFFSRPADATVGLQERFTKEKRPGAVRIFVLGESTTIGYPYMHNGSFHRLLKYRLMHTFPDTHFEIINLSLTAVNSYTVLDFARSVVDQSPDAVLIYAGHNEYYGAMGVGSSNPLLAHTVTLLRTFRTVQLFTNLARNIRSIFIKTSSPDQTLMERMAAEQQIPYGSEIYQKGVRQFSTNLDAVCRLFSNKNIPVFISTLVSNEKDLQPFISATGANSAGTKFQQAQAAYAGKDYNRAKHTFIEAKELDLLRFRAPDTFDLIINRLSAAWRNIHIVDTRSLFEQHSPHGILGNETLLEHVHPNLYGYTLMSEAFYQALHNQHLISPNWPAITPFEDFAKDIPVSPVDSLKGAYEIAQLKTQWPFNGPKTTIQPHNFEEQLALHLLTGKTTWNQAIDTLLPYYLSQNRYADALKVAESALLEYPDEPAFYAMAARCSMRLGKAAQAAFYMQKAFELQPSRRNNIN